MSWSAVISSVNRLGLLCQLKGRNLETPSGWTAFLIEPAPGYIESTCGPIPFREIEWLLVNPVYSKERGRLVAPFEEDRSEFLKKNLEEAGMAFSQTSDGVLVVGTS